MPEVYQYLNVEISPSGLNGTQNFELSEASYSRQFNYPIIPKNAGDYNVAVVSYDIPSTTIPLLLPEIQPFPNTNPNLTPYSFTMTYNGFVGPQTYLTYSSDNLNSAVPPALTASSPTRNSSYNYYYYVFSIQNWVDQLNATLKAAFNALSSAYVGAPAFPVGAVAPYFIFKDGKISLISQIANFNTDSTVAYPIFISYNTSMARFMQGFSTLNTSLSNGRNFLFNNKFNESRSYYAENTAINFPPTLMKLQQEWDTFEAWYSMKSLNIVTSSLPIREEYLNNASDLVNGYGTVVSSQAILATFIPLYGTTTIGDIRRRIQYSATALRPIAISDVEKIDAISLKIVWTDYLDREYQLFIEPWERISIKLLFFKEGSIYPMDFNKKIPLH